MLMVYDSGWQSQPDQSNREMVTMTPAALRVFKDDLEAASERLIGKVMNTVNRKLAGQSPKDIENAIITSRIELELPDGTDIYIFATLISGGRSKMRYVEAPDAQNLTLKVWVGLLTEEKQVEDYAERQRRNRNSPAEPPMNNYLQ